MCFAIPYKVIKVNKKSVLIEGNIAVRIEKELKVLPGDYLQVVGNLAVSKLAKKDGVKIRQLIKSLNDQSFS